MHYIVDIIQEKELRERLIANDIETLSLYQKAEQISIAGTGRNYKVTDCTLVVSDDNTTVLGLLILAK